ncbi:hypothetical protein SCLCIDRAFT_377741 [Scleroderma citrinum Foug A]|uniref:Uncharacterized protein n=1 Tax=Scleroderma citrinum Foug A TaxID=1036808 RepID=A0A0C3DDK2_9AGAM|nr:hypothetical protein SCLCIDRAFT_377741 [Scleroderma citrinum Foug A]
MKRGKFYCKILLPTSTIQDHPDHWVPALGPRPGDLPCPSLGLCEFFQLNLL